MGRTNKLDMERRLRDCEKHLVALGRTAAVKEALSKKYDVSQDTVKRWIAKVRQQWVEEARTEEQASGVPLREGRRVHLREMLLDLHAKAQSRTQTVIGADGKVIMISDGKGGERPLLRPHPNNGVSLQVMRQLRALDALDQPKVKHVHHSGSIASVDPDADRTPDEERFYLTHGRWPTKKELAAFRA